MSAFDPTQTLAKVMMCGNCLQREMSITTGIPRTVHTFFCRGCERYLQPPASWVMAAWESRELLAYCLKRLRGLKKVHVMDASFIYTEPHSRRIKVKVTVQQEVFTGTILQQAFQVEYVVNNQQCPECAASYTDHTWTAVVQVRQKVPHKKTFLWLEQVLLKHRAHLAAVRVKEQADGLDFYFGHKNKAARFTEFVLGVVPARSSHSKKLISQDDHSNTFRYNYTTLIEIAPVCRDDLVCLPPSVLALHGNPWPVMLCSRVSNQIHLLDPLSLNGFSLNAQNFWGAPFEAMAHVKQCTPFIVLDVSKTGHSVAGLELCDVEVARECDLGVNDTTFRTRTHLGRHLHAGDEVLGYDISALNVNDELTRSIRGRAWPDVILVRKPRQKLNHGRRSRRHWRLQRMQKEEASSVAANDRRRRNDAERAAVEYEDFLDDVEEDSDLRASMNLLPEDDAEQIFNMRTIEGTDVLVPLSELVTDLAENFNAMNIDDDDDE